MLVPDTGAERTQIVLSRPCVSCVDGEAVFDLRLAPDEVWQLRLDVVPTPEGRIAAPPIVEVRFGTELEHVRESLAAWQLSVPRIRSGWRNIEATIGRSVADLASLRMRTSGTLGRLPAAGMPWFMTVFGRDTIITCLQTLIFGPELARSALEALAALQAREDDPSIDAEPGKIVHELRRGRAAKTWFARYYGTVDATPLFLVLLSETWRWTRDDDLAQALREPALRALDWIDRWGDRDGDGFVEYERRSPRGLVNQSWKDSGDSQCFSDGRPAEPPIAPAEVQGYVYDAKRRLAELARHAWNDEPLARRLERDASELRERFDAAYWIDAARRLLRAGARRPQAARRCALLQHRAPPMERHRPPRTRVPDRRTAPVARALERVGHPDNVLLRCRVQPARIPPRNGLAARHLDSRLGARALRILGGVADTRPGALHRRPLVRLVTPGGVRRVQQARDALPNRIPHSRTATGLGGRSSRPRPPAAARPEARPDRAANSSRTPRPASPPGPARSTSEACPPTAEPGTSMPSPAGTSRSSGREALSRGCHSQGVPGEPLLQPPRRRCATRPRRNRLPAGLRGLSIRRGPVVRFPGLRPSRHLSRRSAGPGHRILRPPTHRRVA